MLLTVSLVFFALLTFTPKAQAVLGDVDGDDDVDMDDIYAIVQAFGSWPSHYRWNADADLNFDDLIDLLDIWIAVTNYGA